MNEEEPTLGERLLAAQTRKAEADAIKAVFIRDYKAGKILSTEEIKQATSPLLREVKDYLDSFAFDITQSMPNVSASMTEEINVKKIAVLNRLAAGPWVDTGNSAKGKKKACKKKGSAKGNKRASKAKQTRQW